MKCRLLLAFLTLLSVSFRIEAQEMLRTWDKGPLTWDDFQQVRDSEAPSYFCYSLNFYEDVVEMGDTTLLRRFATACMNCSQSWVNERNMHDMELRYNQLLFDLVECYRRELQTWLDQCADYRVNDLLNEVLESCALMLDTCEMATDCGRDAEAMEAWEEMVAEQLKKSPSEPKTAVPSAIFEEKASVTSGLGLAVQGFVGSLSSYFKPAVLLDADFGFIFKNHDLNVAVRMGYSNLNKEYELNAWQENERFFDCNVDLTYGYRINLTSTLSAVPFAGVSYLNYSLMEYTDNGLTKASFMPVAGIDWRIRYSTTYDLLSYEKEKSDDFMRVRCGVTYAHFNDLLDGLCFQVSVGFFFESCCLYR